MRRLIIGLITVAIAVASLFIGSRSAEPNASPTPKSQHYPPTRRSRPAPRLRLTTAIGRCPARIMRRRASAASTRSRRRTSASCRSPSPSRPAQPRDSKRRRLVVNNTMYVVAPWPNNVFALDLTKPGAPAKWVYKPNPAAAAKGVACCGPVNRGAFYWNGQALHEPARRQHRRGRRRQRARKSGGPSSPTSRRARPSPWRRWSPRAKCWSAIRAARWASAAGSTALDAGSGKIAWKAYSTGPDKDVLIGPDYRAPYPQDQGKDLGVKSWPPEQWKIGGGTVWGWISYDPGTRRCIYYGTCNPGPVEPGAAARATTNGPPEFSRATSAPARRAGSTRARRTTCTIMTTSTRSCWSIIRSATASASRR